jgi:hypothetical protein
VRYLISEEDLLALSNATRDFGNAAESNYAERHRIMKAAEEKCRSVEVPREVTHFATRVGDGDSWEKSAWIYWEMPYEFSVRGVREGIPQSMG